MTDALRDERLRVLGSMVAHHDRLAEIEAELCALAGADGSGGATSRAGAPLPPPPPPPLAQLDAYRAALQRAASQPPLTPSPCVTALRAAPRMACVHVGGGTPGAPRVAAAGARRADVLEAVAESCPPPPPAPPRPHAAHGAAAPAVASFFDDDADAPEDGDAGARFDAKHRVR
jgi:hypothetical protein